MLKIVYPVCCGIDVHKTFIYCCIATTDNKDITTYKSNRFSTFTNQLKRCATWLKENDCKDVCMESTGKYWIADLFKHDLINGSFIPPADIHQLRDLTRYRNKLTNFIVSEKNRAQNCLTVSNIKLDDVFILWLDFYLQDSLM